MLPASEVTIAKQVRVLLDVGIVVGSLFGLALVFLISPRVASGTPADVVFGAYPIADLTLLLALVVLTVRGVTSLYRPVFFWMTAGMLCFVWADSLFNYFSLPGLSGGASYQPGTAYIDPAWVAAAFCFGLAALSMRRAQRQEEAAWVWVSRVAARLAKVVPTGLFGQFLLLATPVVVLITLLITGKYLPERSNPQTGLELLTLLVVLLIIIRQLVTQIDLIDARVATQRAQQLDDLKDQFITSVNHELRTPIQTMTGYIELLAELQDRPSAEKRAEMLERAHRANTSLVHLLRSILDTRRIEQEVDDLELVPVNVRTVAQKALELLDPREVSVRERRLFWSVPEHLMVLADETRLQEVMMNLLSNAIKYSAPGTSVTLIAQPMTEKSPRFRLHTTPGKRLVEITVHDEGLGIPAEQIPLLFRRFVRLPRDLASKVHGTGLGLYLCRLFVEAMGGLIWVESSGVAGEGSTFHIRLPAASATPQTSRPISRQDLVPLDSQDS
jgi:signal transduction histidine kinase